MNAFSHLRVFKNFCTFHLLLNFIIPINFFSRSDLSYLSEASLKYGVVSACVCDLTGSTMREQDLFTDGPPCGRLGAESLNSEPASGSVRQTGFLVAVPASVLFCSAVSVATHLVFSPFKR